MDGMTLRRGKLPPTKTFSARGWTWLELPGASFDGVLGSWQIEEKTGRHDENFYGVEEVPCAFPAGREFIVRKLGAAMGADDEQYRTTVLPRGSRCNCRAGQTHTERCRHRDSLQAMIECGAIPVRELAGA